MATRILIAITLCLFLISFVLPAFYIDTSEKDAWSNSIALFFFGWLGLLMGSVSCVAWLANPIFILALISLFKKKKVSILFSLFALLFAVSFLSVNTIIVSEAPTYAKIASIESGYWFWLASMALMLVTTITALLSTSNHTKHNVKILF